MGLHSNSLLVSVLFLFLCQITFSAVTNKDHGALGQESKPSTLFNGMNPKLIKRMLLEKSLIPDYVQQFLQVHEANSHARLFDGVGETCSGHIKEWITRVSSSQTNITSDKEKWVLQMIDSWGKFPDGILSGHVNSLGDFHECIQINVQDLQILNENKNLARSFKGRYCTNYIVDYETFQNYTTDMNNSNLKHLKRNQSNDKSTTKDIGTLESVSFEELIFLMLGREGPQARKLIPTFATCFPNSCSQTEIHNFLGSALTLVYNYHGVEVEEMPWPIVAFCEEQDKPAFSAGDIAVIVLLAVIFSLCLAAGILDIWRNEFCDETPPLKGKALQYLMAFSFYTNTRKWLSTRKSAEDMGCIHGIRFLSTAWVVYGHTYDAFSAFPAWNFVDLKKIHQSWSLMPVLNGTFSVDTFFLMSGMLAAYNILKMLQKTGGKFNIIMFYIHRYIRLTPTYAILVAFFGTLIIYMGNGPYWSVISVPAQYCRDYWWTNLLYINTLVHAETQCNGVSWYLANDFQFYLVSPFMVYPIWRWRKIGIAFLSVVTVLSVLSPVLVAEFQDAPVASVLTRDLPWKNFITIYQKPWTRIQVFIVGIWLGWILFETKGKRVKIPMILAILGWVLSAAFALSVIYGIQPWFDPANEIPKVGGWLYAGLSRFTFAVSVAWVIFACLKGYGGLVNKFLSWKVFMPLGRLTYCVYLISFTMQILYHARYPHAMSHDVYNFVNLFFGHLIMTFLVGFLCTIVLESPFIILHKLLFEGALGSGAKNKPAPKLPERKQSLQMGSTRRSSGDPQINGNAITGDHISENNEKDQ